MKATPAQESLSFRAALEQLRDAIEHGDDDAVEAAASLGWSRLPPTAREVDRAEAGRHGGATRARRSTTQVALDGLRTEVQRQRMAVRPEIDLSPWSKKMQAMDKVCAETGVDFTMVKDALAEIHYVHSLENVGNAGMARASLGGHFDCEFIRDFTAVARDIGHEFPDDFRALVMRGASLQGQPSETRAKATNPIAAAMMMAHSGEGPFKGEAERQAVKALIDQLLIRFKREEEDGRIFHENRDDKRGAELEAAGWSFPYYGATDTAPGFVTSAWRYMSLYPETSFLESPVILDPKVDPSKQLVSVRESIVNALRWVVHRMDDPRGGDFLWNQRMEGASGIANQSWMDSGDSFEFKGPYAPIELQGMAYDALILGADMLRKHPGEKGPMARSSIDAAQELERRAAQLRKRFFEEFPIEKDGKIEMLAHAIRVNDDGTIDRSRWAKSNVGRLLDSRLFDTDDPKILAIRDAVVDRLFQKDMQGPYGLIRTLSKDAPNFHPLAYHNGSIWPTDNMAIAHGLLRQQDNTRKAAIKAERAGNKDEAKQLEAKADDFRAKAMSIMKGILQACANAERQGFPAPEWIPGVTGMPIPQKEEFEVGPDGRKRITTLSPMRVQGWTVSAMWASASYLADRKLKAEDPTYRPGVEIAKARGVPEPQEHPASRPPMS